jgi:hypothetical protein
MNVGPVATQRILDALCERYRASIVLVRVSTLPATAYGFDAAGWNVFAVLDRRSNQAGVTEYVAVHQESREVRLSIFRSAI